MVLSLLVPLALSLWSGTPARFSVLSHNDRLCLPLMLMAPRNEAR